MGEIKMKIEKSNELQNKYTNSIKNPQTSKKSMADTSGAVKDISVEISSSAKILHTKVNEFDKAEFSEKVEDIKRLVNEGKYDTSSEKISEKVLQEIEEQRAVKFNE